jgi:small-conductance mechanosensitive channel
VSWDAILLAAGQLWNTIAVRVILALVAGLIAWRVAVWVRDSFVRVAERRGVDRSARLLGARLIYGALLVLGIVWVLQIIGLELTLVLGTLGIAGLAFSLAVQDILKSFFAGLYMLFERPFLIGDEIQIKEHVGRVEHIGFRATSVRTADNVVVVVPNSMLFVEAISNRSQRHPPET